MTRLDGDLALADFRAEPMPLIDLLRRSAARTPDAEALVFPDVRLSYAELVGRVEQSARRLWAAGVRPRDHVGILLPSSDATVVTLFAVSLCGATSVMLNARYRPAELAYVLENADVSVLVTTTAGAEHGDFVARLRQAFPTLLTAADPAALDLAQAPRLRTVLLDEGDSNGFVAVGTLQTLAESLPGDTLDHARIGSRVRDPAMILYTSGTSANPKGCLLSHEAMSRQAQMIATRWQYTADDRVWSPLPLFHVAAMDGLLAILSRGGTFIGMPHFEPDESLRMIERERATSLFVPFVTFLQAMAHSSEFATVDLSRVRHANTCFAAQPAKVGAMWRAKAPHIQHVGTFGLTEAFGIVATGGGAMDPDKGFTGLGWPLLGIEVRIVDPITGTERATGEQGEVLVRGPTLFDGYYRDPERSAAALDSHGWLHTGDIGSVEADGQMLFHGRFKDMLKVGGENVAAAEVEAVLAQHPAVRLAQVVGIPDERLIEVPAAFIEGDPAGATAEELMFFVRERIAPFKVPRHIRFVEEWPMSASKIQKFRLRQGLLDELGIVEG